MEAGWPPLAAWFLALGFANASCATRPVYPNINDAPVQWSASTIGTGASLQGVWGSPGGDVWIVGTPGTVLQSSDRGATWTAPPAASFAGARLNDVWGDGHGKLYLVAQDRVLFYSLDHGATWTTQTLLAGLPSGVWGAGDDVFICADDAVLHGSAGGSWTGPSLGSFGGLLIRIWGASAKDVYTVGEDLGTPAILHSRDVGASWSEQKLPGDSEIFLGVWGSASDDLYVVGAGGVILHSTDGAKWTSQSSGTSRWLRGAWGFARGNVYVVGDGEPFSTRRTGARRGSSKPAGRLPTCRRFGATARETSGPSGFKAPSFTVIPE